MKFKKIDDQAPAYCDTCNGNPEDICQLYCPKCQADWPMDGDDGGWSKLEAAQTVLDWVTGIGWFIQGTMSREEFYCDVRDLRNLAGARVRISLANDFINAQVLRAEITIPEQTIRFAVGAEGVRHE